MRLLSIISTIALSATVAQAQWHLKLYNDNHKTLFEDSDFLPKDCITIETQYVKMAEFDDSAFTSGFGLFKDNKCEKCALCYAEGGQTIVDDKVGSFMIRS